VALMLGISKLLLMAKDISDLRPIVINFLLGTVHLHPERQMTTTADELLVRGGACPI
jgi:hypothetical protein